MGAPQSPHQPYAAAHINPSGPGDARPDAYQILKDCGALGNLTAKAIVITGASSGIGIATATALYATGARLFLTARDTAKLDAVIDTMVSNSTSTTQFPRPVPVEMHLDSLASVRSAAAFIRSQTSQLNTIIGNAGVMFVPFERTKEGHEMHLGVNHFAHFLLFHELKDLLAQGAHATGSLSRVVLVSSSGHRFSEILFDDPDFRNGEYDATTAYGQSKTANVYMANTISRYYAREGITALSLHPGVIMETDIRRYMSEGAVQALHDQTDPRQLKSPEQGVATTVWAAVSPYFDDIANGGRYLADVGECAPMPSGSQRAVGVSGYADFAYDEAKADRLWELSCEAVGIPVEGSD